MPTIKYVNPADQPLGTFRMLDWLEANFKSSDYNRFWCLVAFAKVKPFYKLHNAITDWNSKGKSSEVVIGIDHKGTSYQALQYVLANFNTVRILHTDYSTFHPKMYIFEGPSKATIYYGSSNFTSGGLETNFEGGVILEFNLPAEQTDFGEAFKNYSSVLSINVSSIPRLDLLLLDSLYRRKLLLDESTSRRKTITQNTSGPSVGVAATPNPFGAFKAKPARSIPKSVMQAAAVSAGIVLPAPNTGAISSNQSPQMSPTPANTPNVLPIIVDGFVIQVTPHHNGEILLSKLAINQNPKFFGMPFTGFTTPKKATNSSYPQRVPDPMVNIRVFDSTGVLVNSVIQYPLNTILYTLKSEIRITITPSILSGLQYTQGSTDYPILVMSNSLSPNCDYDMDFYAKGSQVYDDYLAICDQELPSGGKSVARKMGWI